MKHEHINYFAVGLFVITMVTAFVTVIILLTGKTGDTDSYTVFYDNIAGLKYGTNVSYEGYLIGQVDGIEPVQESGATQYKVNFSVRQGWKIPDDSIAKMVSSGLLSDVAINIIEGASKKSLSPGETIKGEAGSNVFASMNSAAGEIKLLISDMRKITNILTEENGVGDIMKGMGVAVSDVKRFTEKMNASADRIQNILGERNQQRIDDFLVNMNTASKDLASLTTEINRTLSTIESLVSNTGNVVSENRKDLRKAIQNLNSSMQVVADNINSITYNLDITSRNMSEFTRQIRENPGLLLGSKPPQDKVTR